MKEFEDGPGGTIRFVARVIPRSGRNEVSGWTAAGELKIKLTSPPVDNAANESLVRLLADVLGVRKREVSIVSGRSSRKKKIEVPESCKNRLSSFNDI